ncbi:MAG: branched-chain amino acid ABC transporter [Betaproteobacteria bacterium RIFCSPLOWO2_12_FULL_68_20]|nr:MAG: branched-chain amino acid ABC transporter [Betaproteobacteria bacterium RIFCSPLOWO2_12_FULL_68_20]
MVRAQAQKLKVGVLLPRSGVQGFIGQSCQKGADLAPGVIKQMLGVDIELMNADTESSVDTARTRAERLVQEGAHVLVGPFDSGAAAAIAQVAEQRGVPFVINIAAAPQITEQGYKFVFRNFQTGPDIARNGLALIGDLFQATNTAPRTAVFMHVNDTFGQAMLKGISAFMPRMTQLPFKIVDTISYDPAAKDLTVEVSKAKASNADFLLLVCRLNDAIILRREMVKQRWNPMGIISPGSPGMYEEQYYKALGKLSEYSISNVPWYNPNAKLTKIVEKAFLKQNPKDKLVFHGLNAGFTFEAILIAADAFKRARSTDPKTLADAIRQTNITEKMMLGAPIKFNAKGQVEGIGSACVQNLNLTPTVVLPAAAATAKPVFPAPYFKRA